MASFPVDACLNPGCPHCCRCQRENRPGGSTTPLSPTKCMHDRDHHPELELICTGHELHQSSLTALPQTNSVNHYTPRSKPSTPPYLFNKDALASVSRVITPYIYYSFSTFCKGAARCRLLLALPRLPSLAPARPHHEMPNRASSMPAMSP